ncbi:hypothetical protein [Amycolatopsis sp. EV170708-02-1]|uniref:hypothetical protein n=1 Tax=Amycolatopsis sp. EV170708-02-1 TaxID=2919322 RepID=UPI0028F40C2A|nr:hypothetical protein [Amycolatopsis sp. EV170708-02-1]
MLEILRDRFRARAQESLTRAGLALPWWVPVSSTFLSVVFAVIAVVQRDALAPPQPVALGGLLVIATPLAWVITGWVVPWARVAALIAAAAVLLVEPALPDFAPLLLLVAATEAGSVLRTTWGIALVTFAAEAVLLVAGIWGGLIGGPVYMVAVLLGLSGGLMTAGTPGCWPPNAETATPPVTRPCSPNASASRVRCTTSSAIRSASPCCT